MAKKSGNTLIKLIVLLAIAGAVFFALDSWRKNAGVDKAASPDAPAVSTAGLSREEAERIGTEIGTRIGTEIGTQIGREVAAEMLAERKIQMADSGAAVQAETLPPAPEPEPVAEPVVEPEPAAPVPEVIAAVESDAEEESLSPTPAPKPATRPKETRTQGTIPGIPVPQPVEELDPWWIKFSAGDADALRLTYAGSFTTSDGKQNGIALMFSGRFNRQSDFSAISISGAGTTGTWKLGANPGLIYLPVSSGSYTVTIKAGLSDLDGKTVKSDISGPVNVR